MYITEHPLAHIVKVLIKNLQSSTVWLENVSKSAYPQYKRSCLLNLMFSKLNTALFMDRNILQKKKKTQKSF